MKKKLLENYARLIVESGINLQKGQDVIIQVNTEAADFAVLVTEECYKRGARLVRVEWLNQEIQKLHYNWRTEETLKTIDKWEIEKYRDSIKKLPCRIWLDSDDPDGLKGVDIRKMGIAVQARGRKLKKLRDQIDGKYQWCIAAVPGEKWAKKLFPELSVKASVEALWEKILYCSRALGDPIKAWEEHDGDLKRRCEYLNSIGIDSLHYTSPRGRISQSALWRNLSSRAEVRLQSEKEMSTSSRISRQRSVLHPRKREGLTALSMQPCLSATKAIS